MYRTRKLGKPSMALVVILFEINTERPRRVLELFSLTD